MTMAVVLLAVRIVWDLVVEVVLGLSNLTLADEPVKYRGTFDIYLVTSVRYLRLRRLNPTTNISTVSLRDKSYPPMCSHLNVR